MTEIVGIICDNIPAISKHLRNIFESGELSQRATVSILEIVQFEHETRV